MLLTEMRLIELLIELLTRQFDSKLRVQRQ